jgi:beta-lactamase regulating signal transducer with metallopeptidase domain
VTEFNAWSASALWTLLEVSLQATLCLVVILLLRRALGNQLRPDWRYALWGVLILRMLLPLSYNAPLLSYAIPDSTPPREPSYPAPIDTRTVDTDQPAEDRPAAAIDSTPDITPTPASMLASATPESKADVEKPALNPYVFPWPETLFTAWLAGAATLLAFVILRHLRLTRAIERNAIPAPDSVSQVLRHVREELRVTLWPAVLLTPSIATPTVIGVLRPRILLPNALAETASRDELRLILMHELMHVRRRDLWIAWLWLVALSLHWFNPLMWWAGARLRRDREQACDLRVLSALPERDRAAYGHTLLKSLTAMNHDKRFTRLAGAAAIVEDEAELEGRLTLIKSYRPARTHHRISGMAAALALACAAFIQTWGVAQQPTTKAPSLPSVSSFPLFPSASILSVASTPPNPFADINDEEQLVKLRDEAAIANDLVRACEAEMRRVKIREAAKNPWKDKIDFTDAYRALPPAANEEELKKRADAVDYFKNSKISENSDKDYMWRIFRLMSLIARDRKDLQYAVQSLYFALTTYPRAAYADPAKQSQFQHLVNETAMLIWDRDGVDEAEKFVVDTWKRDRRFLYFFDAPWKERYEKEKLGSDRLAALEKQLGEKAPPFQITVLVLTDGLSYVGKRATWEEIELYLGRIPDPFNHFIALGYTSEEMPFKPWRDAETRLMKLVEKHDFDHFSDIGLQPPPSAAPQSPAETPKK